MVSPTRRTIAGPQVWCEGKCIYAHPWLGVVWGSKHAFLRFQVHYAVLPTKTSLWFIQFGGRALSFSSIGSQVFTTRLVNPFSLFFCCGYLIVGEPLVDMTEPPVSDFVFV